MQFGKVPTGLFGMYSLLVGLTLSLSISLLRGHFLFVVYFVGIVKVTTDPTEV